MYQKPITNNLKKNCRIYIGGSFDPVHLGHLSMAEMIETQLMQLYSASDASLDCTKTHTRKNKDNKHVDNKHVDNKYFEINFLPTAGSPFKNTQTLTDNRIAMLQLATQNTNYHIDTREISQTPPVYSYDTLSKIRKQYTNDSIIFVMGLDSLASLPNWKNGLQLLELCHLWVFNRDSLIQQNINNENNNTSDTKPINPKKIQNHDHLSEKMEMLVPNSISSHVFSNFNTLLTHSNGSIYLDTRTPPPISSSYIRTHIHKNGHKTDTKNLLSSQVWEYIKDNGLYIA